MNAPKNPVFAVRRENMRTGTIGAFETFYWITMKTHSPTRPMTKGAKALADFQGWAVLPVVKP